jgi:threonine/homoserine/homoserine lactone efflux protein
MILAQAFLLGLISALTPGPLQTFLIAESLRRGWRAAVIAFAPPLADIPIIVLAVVLLDRLPAPFLLAVRLMGGLLLLYLAWGLVRSVRTPATSDAPPEATRRRGLLARAVLIIWLAPAPYLFWTTVLGPLLVTSWRQSPVAALFFLVTFYVGIVGSSLALVGLISRGRTVLPGAQRPLLLACGIVLAFVGVSLLWSGVAGLAGF